MHGAWLSSSPADLSTNWTLVNTLTEHLGVSLFLVCFIYRLQVFPFQYSADLLVVILSMS